ncbi:MAG: hypothetical protein Q7R56_03030 [Nanoarchaeota archaeon]|nr:hypothetical protein [Nanoarchaeota archaeon]
MDVVLHYPRLEFVEAIFSDIPEIINASTSSQKEEFIRPIIQTYNCTNKYLAAFIEANQPLATGSAITSLFLIGIGMYGLATEHPQTPLALATGITAGFLSLAIHGRLSKDKKNIIRNNKKISELEQLIQT